MIKSTCKKAIENIRAYIMDAADYECLGLQEGATFPEVAAAILRTCEDEKRYSNSSGYTMFVDWAQGLPSALNTCYYYNVSAVALVGGWLEQTAEESSKYEETEAEERATQLIYRELCKGQQKYMQQLHGAAKVEK